MKQSFLLLCFFFACNSAYSQHNEYDSKIAYDSKPKLKDSIATETQKVAFLMIVNFNHSNFRWMTGYRKFNRKYRCDPSGKTVHFTDIPPYTYYFSNKKTLVKNDIVDVKVLKQ